MFKLVFLVLASALIIEGAPSSTGSSLAEAIKNGNWEVFQSLLRQNAQNSWTALASNVENLKKPDDKTHVFGHAVSTYKEWSSDNGNVSERSDGLEVLNNDGVVSSRRFTP